MCKVWLSRRGKLPIVHPVHLCDVIRFMDAVIHCSGPIRGWDAVFEYRLAALLQADNGLQHSDRPTLQLAAANRKALQRRTGRIAVRLLLAKLTYSVAILSCRC